MRAPPSSEASQESCEPPPAAKFLARRARVSRSAPSRSASRIASLAALLVFAFPAAAEKAKDLRPQGYVNDFAGVLSPQARERLTSLCREVDEKAQAQIAIVTIHTLEGVPVEDFSVDLATRWGIGPKQKDRGVLILLAVNDRRYRVEVGYGLEGILPDGRVGGFGREMVPFLRRDDYGGALLLLASRVAQVIAQDRGVTLATSPAEVPPAESEPSSGFGIHWLWPLIVVILVFFRILRVLFGLGLVGPRGRQRRRTFWMGGPWIGGGSWGGGSWGGGGGFGGFGGGSFGGGGASGSW